MDRFIDFAFIFRRIRISHLKSNMDRFIAGAATQPSTTEHSI